MTDREEAFELGANLTSITRKFQVAVMLRVLKMAGDPRLALELDCGKDGWVRVAIHEGDLPSIRFHDNAALLSMFRNPSLRFGELYSSGRVTVRGDLTQLMEALYRGLECAQSNPRGLIRLYQRLSSDLPATNTLTRSRSNVHKHYDIGNDFYGLWLDRDYQQYTCAYYADNTMGLEDAQRAKLDLVCRKLALRPGESVVEAGGGWGGLARYLARTYGVRVCSYNISTKQIEYARERAAIEGLDHLIEYVEDDYRNIKGTYDVFVSVGMLEHVGLSQYSAVGKTIDRCLKDDGRGLIHSIGQRKPRRLNPWIEQHIFPGAYAPSLKQMMEIFEPVSLEVVDVENLRSHYALTLKHWAENFDRNVDTVRNMFGENFVRTWRLYLRGSQAAFTAGGLQLYQVLFRRAESRAIPATRDRLFTDRV